MDAGHSLKDVHPYGSEDSTWIDKGKPADRCSTSRMWGWLLDMHTATPIDTKVLSQMLVFGLSKAPWEPNQPTQSD